MTIFVVLRTIKRFDDEEDESELHVVASYKFRETAEVAVVLLETDREQLLDAYKEKVAKDQYRTKAMLDRVNTAQLAVTHWELTYQIGATAGLPETKASLEKAKEDLLEIHKEMMALHPIEGDWDEIYSEYRVEETVLVE